MAIDPGLGALLKALRSAGIRDLAQASDPVAARRQFRAMTADIRPEAMVIPVGPVSDGSIEGPAGSLRTRTYRPVTSQGVVPTILFLHGGGWVIGDLDTHDNQARRLCREVGAAAVPRGRRGGGVAGLPAAPRRPVTGRRRGCLGRPSSPRPWSVQNVHDHRGVGGNPSTPGDHARSERLAADSHVVSMRGSGHDFARREHLHTC